MRKKIQTAVIVLVIVLLSVGATLMVQSLLGEKAGKDSVDVEARQDTNPTEPAVPASDDREDAGVVQAQALPEGITAEELLAQSARVDEAVRAQAGSWVQFVEKNGRGVEGRVLVGAPGLWPYETLGTNPDGLILLPSVDVTTLAKNTLYHYELLARSDDPERPMAFWDEYNSPLPDALKDGLVAQARVVMEPAADVRFQIVDDKDKPVMGAFVRLSRDSVGLLHLTFTTGPDGRAVFSRLPPGQYSITLNAQGFGRTVFDIDHTLDAKEEVVALGEGGSFRRPLSWRQNPSAAVVPKPQSPAESNASESNTGGAASSQPAESGGKASSGESKNARQLRVFVVDDDGAPVVGAYVEFWAGDSRAASGTSKGHQSLELRASNGAGRLIAIYPGMGEGDLAVEASSENDERVDRVITLDLPLFASGAVSGRFHNPEQIEDVLGVELVDMDREWMFDTIEPDSIAGRAGILRGDSLLSLRQTATGFEAVVNRRGQIRRIVM